MNAIHVGARTCAGWLVALCLACSTRAQAQAGSDSLAQSAPADTLRPPGTPGTEDSPRADTTSGTVPETRRPTVDSTAGLVASADTTLARACTGMAPGTLAPGLLAVVFRPGTTAPEAVEAARAVGGTIAGQSDMGEVYVGVPPGAGALAVVADQLIRQVPVTRVTPIPCPARRPAPPPAGAVPEPVPADTSGAEARDSTAAPAAPGP